MRMSLLVPNAYPAQPLLYAAHGNTCSGTESSPMADLFGLDLAKCLCSFSSACTAQLAVIARHVQHITLHTPSSFFAVGGDWRATVPALAGPPVGGGSSLPHPQGWPHRLAGGEGHRAGRTFTAATHHSTITGNAVVINILE